ncbi:MAG TPA: DinB family protein [Micromonosporaceae bacterium]|nr:DinB family protein [Micromonosporaceae bacterium]
MTTVLDRQAVYDELERVRVTFRGLSTTLSTEDMSRPSNGTRWTNRQLFYHLLFGYIVVVVLLPLVKLLAMLPRGATKPFAAVLDFSTRPFHFMNYIASVIGPWMFSTERMVRMLDRITTGLARGLAAETEPGLQRGMHFPTRWDPFFTDFMTVGDLYHYPTLHFDFHQRQLSA